MISLGLGRWPLDKRDSLFTASVTEKECWLTFPPDSKFCWCAHPPRRQKDRPEKQVIKLPRFDAPSNPVLFGQYNTYKDFTNNDFTNKDFTNNGFTNNDFTNKESTYKDYL